MQVRDLGCAVLGAVLLLGCEPPAVRPPEAQISIRFDLTATPPVVPSPNDLARDPVAGRLNVPVNETHTAADRELIAYLNTLDGFPVASASTFGLNGHLDPASVTLSSIRVLDATAGFADVSGATLVYEEDVRGIPARITIKPPPGGWPSGHTFAIAALTGEGDLRGRDGERVAGTSAWLLLRSSQPLVTCQDLTASDCRPTTDVIPSAETELGPRLAEQTEKAVLLEGIRRQYVPALDHLAAHGVPRERVGLLWTFTTTALPKVVYDPNAVPARIPAPNDLAIDPRTGLIAVTPRPDAPPAEHEFLTGYLNTLRGFPGATSLSVELEGGTLDPATVTLENVRFFEQEPGTEPLPVTLGYDLERNRLTLTPPGGTWPKARTFGVAIISSAQRGLRMSDGARFPVGSEVAALLKAPVSLTTCEDLADPGCASALSMTELPPESAIRLETTRRRNLWVIDALAAEGVDRSELAAVWTFTIMAEPEAWFDPANRIIPFANDLVRVEDGGVGRVALPVPDAGLLEDGGVPTAVQLIENLNTLDGFSTTATLVSENAEQAGTLDYTRMSEASLDGGVGFVRVDGAADPEVAWCFNCTSSSLPDGGPQEASQQLQVVPLVPLQERTRYAAYVRSTATDEAGRPVLSTPAFALLRSSAPLVDAEGRSQVYLVSDAQARQLEPVRQQLKPAIDALVARGIPRTELSLAWSYTTQSFSEELAAVGASPEVHAVPTAVTHLSTTLTSLVKMSSNNPFPYDQLGTVYIGRLTVPDLLVAPGGRMDLSAPSTREVPFMLTVPSGTAPTGGFPVALWLHPITASRLTALGIANALSGAGIAVLAIDLPWHGDRATCVGSRDSLALGGAASDDAACADPATQTCDASTGRCIARPGQGRALCEVLGKPDDALCFINNDGLCLADGRCEGGGFAENPATGLPAISGWNFIRSDFFAVRDNLRQGVADVAQLVRIIGATGAGSLNDQLGARALDPLRIHLVGQSLGGTVGALAAAATPGVQRVAVSAPASDLPSVLYTGLTPEARASFLTNAAAAGQLQGTPSFDQFINILRWALDAGDPVNFGPSILGPREVLVQYIEGDPVFPNLNTEKLTRALSAAGPVQVRMLTGAPNTGGTDRHGYLITGLRNTNTDPELEAVSTEAQAQIVSFLTTGAP